MSAYGMGVGVTHKWGKRGSRKLGARSYPLRRIVSESMNAYGCEVETLECGHTIHRPEDFFGPTNAVRRRCRHCWKETQKKEGGTHGQVT